MSVFYEDHHGNIVDPRPFTFDEWMAFYLRDAALAREMQRQSRPWWRKFASEAASVEVAA